MGMPTPTTTSVDLVMIEEVDTRYKSTKIRYNNQEKENKQYIINLN